MNKAPLIFNVGVIFNAGARRGRLSRAAFARADIGARVTAQADA